MEPVARRSPVDQLFADVGESWLRRYQEGPSFRTRLTTIGPEVIRATLESETGRVLDFGGGAGVFSAVASTHATMVLNLDRSIEMLLASLRYPEDLSRLALLVNGKFRPKQVQRVAGDLGVLGIGAKEYFDVVLAIAVLEYIADVPAAIRDLAGLLKPGGEMILEVPNPYSILRHSQAVLHRLDLVRRVVWPFRRKTPISWMSLRPNGDRLPWKVALRDAGMRIVVVSGVALGPGRPRRWCHPNLLVVAMKPNLTTEPS
jgi:2-polyprenyl-3-methyl-5-hydroxy-6-metoxy-1,4-benzoquinol methylase